MKEDGRDRGRFAATGYQAVEVEGVKVISDGKGEAGMTDRGDPDDGKRDNVSHVMPRPDGVCDAANGSSSSGSPVDHMHGKSPYKTPVRDNSPVVKDNIGKIRTTHGNNATTEGDILSQLMANGISESIAKEMMREYPAERIARQIRMLKFRNAREPGAMLVKAIREDWAAPSAYMAQKRAEAARKAKMESEAREAERRRQWQRRIDAAKEKLSPDELQKITRAAREKVRRDLSGVLHGEAPESLVRAETNRIISEKYMSHG
jgi:hypothetical protein